MNFEIVTYASASYWPALELMQPSWEWYGSPLLIRVYEDKFFNSPCTSLEMAWKRKIEALIDAERCCKTEFFCWLDADVYCAGNFAEAFERIGSAEIGATRMFNHTRRGLGAANSGVIFFRRTPKLAQFFIDWQKRTAELEKEGRNKPWFEQTAFSELVHEAFHGQRPYYATPLSENIYNLEDDHTEPFLQRIETCRPKLIHFKNGWWRRNDLVQDAISRHKNAL